MIFENGAEIWVKATVRNHIAGDVYDIEVGQSNDIATVERSEIMER